MRLGWIGLAILITAAGCGRSEPPPRRQASVRPGPGGSGTLPPGSMLPLPTAASQAAAAGGAVSPATGPGTVPGMPSILPGGRSATAGASCGPATTGAVMPPAAQSGSAVAAGVGSQAGPPPPAGVCRVGGATGYGVATVPAPAVTPSLSPAAAAGARIGSFVPTNVPGPVTGAPPPRIGEPSAGTPGTGLGPGLPAQRDSLPVPPAAPPATRPGSP